MSYMSLPDRRGWGPGGDGGDEEVRYSGGQPGDGRGHVGQIPLGPFCHLSPLPAAPASRFFSPERSLTATL